MKCFTRQISVQIGCLSFIHSSVLPFTVLTTANIERLAELAKQCMFSLFNHSSQAEIFSLSPFIFVAH